MDILQNDLEKLMQKYQSKTNYYSKEINTYNNQPREDYLFREYHKWEQAKKKLIVLMELSNNIMPAR